MSIREAAHSVRWQHLPPLPVAEGLSLSLAREAALVARVAGATRGERVLETTAPGPAGACGAARGEEWYEDRLAACAASAPSHLKSSKAKYGYIAGQYAAHVSSSWAAPRAPGRAGGGGSARPRPAAGEEGGGGEPLKQHPHPHPHARASGSTSSGGVSVALSRKGLSVSSDGSGRGSGGGRGGGGPGRPPSEGGSSTGSGVADVISLPASPAGPRAAAMFMFRRPSEIKAAGGRLFA
ncbi:MAG: hypothetical protein J3K34DRAFT_520646 [Monoraphidium minutum]|nr:MAG: hypothetical protein J3K34DRAFT_520646 [Monoraphidium minutum]